MFCRVQVIIDGVKEGRAFRIGSSSHRFFSLLMHSVQSLGLVAVRVVALG